MKLRSAQFVLLVLLFSSLSLSEVSSLRLADEIIGTSSVASARTPARSQRQIQPLPSEAGANQVEDQPIAAIRQAWTMRAPAAQAASLQAVTAYPSVRRS